MITVLCPHQNAGTLLEQVRSQYGLLVQKSEKEQAADKEMKRVRRLGTETDAALSALPEGTIVVYSDGGYQQAADPADDRAGFGWSAHRNPKGPTASVGEMVEYGLDASRFGILST